MVAETLLTGLRNAQTEAGVRRGRKLEHLEHCRDLVETKKANLDRAQHERTLAAEREKERSETYSALLDFVNKSTDKTGRDGIMAEIERLSVKQRETLQELHSKDGVVEQCGRELEDAHLAVKIAEREFEKISQDCQGIALAIDRVSLDPTVSG